VTVSRKDIMVTILMARFECGSETWEIFMCCLTYLVRIETLSEVVGSG